MTEKTSVRHYECDTGNALYRAILDEPGDVVRRLIFADWLDENEREVACRRCNGRCLVPSDKWEFDCQMPCPDCLGSGRVSNGFAARAEFIRLMCDGVNPTHQLWKKAFPAGDSPFHPRTEDGINVGDGSAWFTSEVLNAEWTHLPRGLIRNGFVDEIRCSLEWWLGGECGRCAGTGIYTDDEMRCFACYGTGRTPGCGADVVARHPVSVVRVTDREPADRSEINGCWYWFKDESFEDPYHARTAYPNSRLPADIFELMAGKPTTIGLPAAAREAAVEALSDALVDMAREAAGLRQLVRKVEVNR